MYQLDNNYLLIDLNSIDEQNTDYLLYLFDYAKKNGIKKIKITNFNEFLKLLSYDLIFCNAILSELNYVDVYDQNDLLVNPFLMQKYTIESEPKATSGLTENLTKNTNNDLKTFNDVDLKWNKKIITCLTLFVIPIIGPIIFLCVIKPTDKLIKSLVIISIFGLNLLFIFFLLGFYKNNFI